MPLYTVQHSCPLSTPQQDELAAAITRLHTQKFTAPSLFVNVTFTDTSSQPTYVAGKRVCTFPPFKRPLVPSSSTNTVSQTIKNSILAHVRHGPSRRQEDYNDLCKSIHEAWDRIVLASNSNSHSINQTQKAPPDQLELNTVFIFGDIVAGREAGMAIPPAGGDVLWLRENLGEFRRRAGEGDERFGELVGEVGERGDLRGVLG